MNELALFSGAGGGILGGKLLGWKTVCAVELETFRCERLAQRQNEGFLPSFPIWNGDIAAFDGRPWRGIVDVVSGGFPCQDISAANPKAIGIAGSRSGLWKEMFRIICEVGPKFVLVENSPMLTGRGLGVVLSDLASVGYHAGWGVLGADDLGGFHRRERLFLVGYAPGFGEPAGFTSPTPREKGETAVSDDANGAVVADSNQVDGWQQQQQHFGEGKRTRDESCWSGEIVANGYGLRELQSQGSEPKERKRFGNRDPDFIWLDREFFEDREGNLRATKPGLCGMAHGVADRVDRISAVGDGQVPVVVAAAWGLLTKQIEHLEE